MASISAEALHLLVAQGLGAPEPGSVKEHRGRNSTFTLTTDADHQLFIKSINRTTTSGGKLLSATIAAEDFLRQSAADSQTLRSPYLLCVDRADGVLVYEMVPDARMVAELALDPDKDWGLLERVMTLAGASIAELHSLDSAGASITSEQSFLPPVEWLDVLPWFTFTTFSAPQFGIWNRLQQDKELRIALTELRRDEDRARKVPIHGDLRLDQYLVDSIEQVWLIDWEEFRLGDPARDVGAVIGEWLHFAVSSLHGHTFQMHNHLLDLDLTHEQILEAGAKALDDVVPLICAFWTEYAKRATVDAFFVRRVVRFAGWHMFDRLLATAEINARPSALEWAGAGIGRRAVLDPDSVAMTLNLTVQIPEGARA